MFVQIYLIIVYGRVKFWFDFEVQKYKMIDFKIGEFMLNYTRDQ